MDVFMNYDKATVRLNKTKPLHLMEVSFKIKPEIKEQKRLFRKSLYKLIIIAEVNNQVYEFEGYDLDQNLIRQLENDPSGFLVGAEAPFLCGTDWPDSGISELVEANHVPLDSLIITDEKNILATIYKEEIPLLINWFKSIIN